MREFKKTYFSLDLTLLQMLLCQGAWGKKFVAFVTISIMVTCALTNAGFILLLFAQEESLNELNFNIWETIVGLILAGLGGLLSGYVQKSIYLDSLNNLEEMWREGLMKGITGNKVYLFWFAVVCAICSFLVNYGMALLGIGVLIPSSSPIIIPMAILFALANSLLVFYTALSAIKQGDTLPDCLNKTKSPIIVSVLAIFFALTAAWGLVMTFYSGISDLIEEHVSGRRGTVAFSIILGLALMTEAYYSFTKACHLAYAFVMRKSKSYLEMISLLTNGLIASTAGIQGGIDFNTDLTNNPVEESNEDENTKTSPHSYIVQSAGGFAAAGWSLTCSADIPNTNENENVKEKQAEDKKKQGLIIHQFTQFKEKAADRKNKNTDVNGVWKLPNLRFA